MKDPGGLGVPGGPRARPMRSSTLASVTSASRNGSKRPDLEHAGSTVSRGYTISQFPSGQFTGLRSQETVILSENYSSDETSSYFSSSSSYTGTRRNIMGHALTYVFAVGVIGLAGPSLYDQIRNLDMSDVNVFLESEGTKTSFQTTEFLNGIKCLSAATAAYFSGVLYHRTGPRPILLSTFLGVMVYLCLDTFLHEYGWEYWSLFLLSLLYGIVLGPLIVTLWSVLLTLPSRNNVGLYISLFNMIWRTSGMVIGTYRAVRYWKFYTPEWIGDAGEVGQVFPKFLPDDSQFRVIMLIFCSCLGVTGLFFIIKSRKHKIVRSDGSVVKFNEWNGIYNDLREFSYVGLDSFVCKMFIAFSFSGLPESYLFDFLLPSFFNGRSQGIMITIYFSTHLFGGLFAGFLLDIKTKSLMKRMKLVWKVMSFFYLVSYTLLLCNQYLTCNGIVDRNRDPNRNLTRNQTFALTWFPPQNGIDGCEFLDNNVELQLLQCVHKGYYGWCTIDLSYQPYVGNVCSRDDSFQDVCVDVIIDYRRQLVLPLVSVIFLAFAHSFMLTLIMWMISFMAGPREDNIARYLSVYFALQYMCLTVAYILIQFDAVLFRYLVVMHAVICLVAMTAIYSGQKSIEQAEYRLQMTKGAAIDHVDYAYYYSYYDSAEEGSLNELLHGPDGEV